MPDLTESEKREVVRRLEGGESANIISREINVSTERLGTWETAFAQGGAKTKREFLRGSKAALSKESKLIDKLMEEVEELRLPRLRERAPDTLVPAPGRFAWAETIIITLLFILIATRLVPEDPFLLAEPFPWLIIAPLFAALHYGAAYGFGSALVLIISILVFWRYDLPGVESFPGAFCLGLLIITMLAGEFIDMWNRLYRRLAVASEYRRLRLDEFTRAYHMLKVSHDRLSERIASSTQSLRGALGDLRDQLIHGSEQRDEKQLFGLGEKILDVFSNFAFVQVAEIYSVEDNKRLILPRLASHGDADAMDPNHPIILAALRSGELISVRSGEGSRPEIHGKRSSILAAIPLTDVFQHTWGMIVIHEMPFIAFHQDNLNLLAVLSGHIGDILSENSGLLPGYEVTLSNFRSQLQRSILDKKNYRLPSHVISVTLERVDGLEKLEDFILSRRRGLDQFLVRKNSSDSTVLLMLMPQTDDMGLEGFLSRLRDMIKEQYGKSLEEAGVNIHRLELQSSGEAKNILKHFQEECDIIY